MKFFIDTANVNEIRAANDMGVIAGVPVSPPTPASSPRRAGTTPRRWLKLPPSWTAPSAVR